jgi:hypothetical protein
MRVRLSIWLLGLLLLQAGPPAAAVGLAAQVDPPDLDLAGRSADPSMRLYSLQPSGLVRQRCWASSRNLLRVGHGAAPDGRPVGCRNLPWLVGRFQRRDWLIGSFRTRPLPTIHDLDVLMWAYLYNPVRPVKLTRPRNIHAVFVDRHQ